MRQSRQPKLSAIVAIVAAVVREFDVTESAIYRGSHEREICLARHSAWWLMRKLMAASFPAIGRHFNGRHHTTVISGVRKIEVSLRSDTKLQAAIGRLLASLTA